MRRSRFTDSLIHVLDVSSSLAILIQIQEHASMCFGAVHLPHLHHLRNAIGRRRRYHYMIEFYLDNVAFLKVRIMFYQKHVLCLANR